MKRIFVAAIAALTVAAAVAVASAATPAVKVKAVGSHYVITGVAPAVKGGTVLAMNITQKGKVVADNSKYTVPSAKNHYKFKIVALKSELPAGRYRLEIVNDKSSGVSYIRFRFRIK